MSELEMRRMTPAKLLILMDARRELMGIQELPLAELKAMYYNSHRDTGDEKAGRPAAALKTVDEFRTFKKRRKGGTLAAKDAPGGRHNQDGAKADRSKWTAYVMGKGKPRTQQVPRS